MPPKRAASTKAADASAKKVKTDATDAAPAVVAPAKRGRGKAAAATVDADNDDDDDAPAPAPAKRARGKTAADPVAAVPTPAPAAVDAPAAKKGRGKAAAAAAVPDASTSPVTTPAPAAVVADAPAAKKGRGKAATPAAAVPDASASASASAAPAPAPAPAAAPADDVQKKTIVVKGKAPVDHAFPYKNSYHVYYEGNDVYDCTLNQTNLGGGANNNKFIILQVLEADSGSGYTLFQRWGRVGVDGQNSSKTFPSAAAAKAAFCAKFKDKTGNAWANRENFVKVGQKYDLVFIDHGANIDEEELKLKSKLANAASKSDDAPVKPKAQSALAAPVQELIKLIGNVKNMEQTMVELEYDVSKLPLGKLTERQVKMGFESLKKIEDAQKSGNRRDLEEACSEFYTRIPHRFGMKKPPLIQTEQELKQKLDLLEALADIQVGMKLLGEAKAESDADPVHPLDAQYNSLNCDMKPIDRASSTFAMIQEYMENTHASTHRNYELDLLDVFEVEKKGEADRFKKDIDNRMLLWHGSRTTNFMGILGQGLRIAPPSAPVTGYMFGKGVYFANMVSKSANYCFTSRTNPTGLLLLCEVAVGKPRELLHADYNANVLPPGHHSTLGAGSTTPNPKEMKVLPDGLKVPLGKPVAAPALPGTHRSLLYDEIIVYDIDQIKLRYLLKVNFKYKY